MVGQLIAQDSRFHQCTVRQFQEVLLIERGNHDYEQSITLKSEFVDGDFQIKSLIAQIVAYLNIDLASPTKIILTQKHFECSPLSA